MLPARLAARTLAIQVSPIRFLCISALLLILFFFIKTVHAENATLTWDPVTYSDLAGYKVYHGTESGRYTASMDVGNVSHCEVSDLTSGITYYFAIRAYDINGQESPYSNEVFKLVEARTGTVRVDIIPQEAGTAGALWQIDGGVWHVSGYTESEVAEGNHVINFKYVDGWMTPVEQLITVIPGQTITTNVEYIRQLVQKDTIPPAVTISYPTLMPEHTTTSGTISLRGTATDNIAVTQVVWSNNRGGTGTAAGEAAWQIPRVTLQKGANVITITARDAAGNSGMGTLVIRRVDSKNGVAQAYLPLEVGEVSARHIWTRVKFTGSFIDPVVAAKPLSINGADPGVVRIRNVTSTGFEIRVQEWDYLDGKHALETIGYIVMERGNHSLPDGTLIEADYYDADNAEIFEIKNFDKAFTKAPMIIAAVTTSHEEQAVTCRVKNVTINGFEYILQEQEANPQVHAVETISYIAWEPSSGVVNDLNFEVAKTAEAVNHAFYTILYHGIFTRIPVFVADMQTCNGPDPASLRWKNKDEVGIEVQVSEEQSRDLEMNHAGEVVGYALFSRTY